jgi:hypothetical protein
VNNPAHATNSKTAALMLVEHIEELARVAWSPAAQKALDPEEGTELRRSLKRLGPTFDELAKWFVEPLRETKPSCADYGYEKLRELMLDVFIVGSRATMSDSAKTLAEDEKLQRARDKKAEVAAPHHAEQLKILQEELARGDRIAWKILTPQVNARLRASGMEAVTEKTMRVWKKKLSSHIS